MNGIPKIRIKESSQESEDAGASLRSSGLFGTTLHMNKSPAYSLESLSKRHTTDEFSNNLKVVQSKSRLVSRKPTNKKPIEVIQESPIAFQPSLKSLTRPTSPPPIIFVPPTIFSSRDLMNKTFLSFRELIDSHQKDVKGFDPAIENPSSKTMIDKQLAFNRTMQRNFFHSVQELKEAADNTKNMSVTREGFLQKTMPRIKKYPSKVNKDNDANQKVLNSVELAKNNMLVPTSLNSEYQQEEMKRQAQILAVESRMAVHKSIKIFKYWNEEFEWTPTARQGASFTELGSKCILFGGASHKQMNTLYKLQSEDCTWEEINAYGDLPAPRRGHTLVRYHRELILYGGEKCFNEHLRVREVMGDLCILDADTY